MSENEVKKWFEASGETFSVLWAKGVRRISRVEETGEGRCYFSVTSGDTHVPLYFTTESEALIVRRDIEAWVKSIQGE